MVFFEYEYIAYVEFCGKKLKIKVDAKDATDARRIITERLHFVKIERPKNDVNDVADTLNSFVKI